MKRFSILLTLVLGAAMAAAQTNTGSVQAPAQTSTTTAGTQVQEAGGFVGTTTSAPLVTTPSMDLGGPLTPPVVRTAPTVVVVTPSPVSTPTVVTVPAAETGASSATAPATSAGAPLNLGAARSGMAFEASDTRSLGEIAAQYRKKDGVQSASRVYTNNDIARLNREQTRDLDLPMSDRDDSETDNRQSGSRRKTTPVAPQSPR